MYDASAISKSIGSSKIAVAKDIIGAKGGAKGVLFPLIDQMLVHINLPKFFHDIIALFFCTQILFSMMWPGNYIIKGEITNPYVSNVLFQIWWFIPCNSTNITPTFVAVTIVFAIMLLWLLFQALYYKTNIRFETWFLYISYILYEFLLPIILYPSAALTGISFLNLLSNGSANNWAVFIFSAIYYISFQIFYRFIYSFSCKSTYLRRIPFLSFRCKIFMYFIILNTACTVALFISSVFVPWVSICILIIHLFFTAFYMYSLLMLPFFDSFINVIVLSLCGASIVSDIISSFMLYFRIVNYILLIVTTVTFIISIIPFYFSVQYIIKKIVRDLTELSPDERDQDLRNLLFSNLGLDINKRKALSYLYVGFFNCCDMFNDMTLIKFLITKASEDMDIICGVIQVLSYFPGEYRLLGSALTMLNQCDLTLQEQFLVYQVLKVKINRQSSISSEANERLSKLMEMTEECECELKSFWNHTKPNLSFTEVYSRKVQKIDSLWEESLRDYPNNSSLSEGFSRFRAECSSDIDGAIVMKKRAKMIEGGHNFSVDVVFRLMISRYPQYIRKEILDTKGNFIRKNQRRLSSSSTGGPSSKLSSSEISTGSSLEIAGEQEELMSLSLFTDGKLRLILHQSLDKRSTFSIQWTSKVYFFLTALMLASTVVVFFYVQDAFQTSRYSMDRLRQLSNMRFAFDLSNGILFTRFLLENGKMRTTEYPEVGYTNGTENDYIDAFSDLNKQLMEQISDTRGSLKLFLNNMAELSEQGFDVYSMAELMMTKTVPLGFCDGTTPKPNRLTSIRLLVSISSFYMAMLASDKDSSDWFTKAEVCEEMINYDTSITVTSDLFDSIYNDQLRRSEQLQQELLTIVIAFSITMFVVMFIPMLLFVFVFIYDANSGMKALLSINTITKEQAMRPILKKSKADKTPSELQISSSIWIAYMISWLVIVIVMSILALLYTIEPSNACDDIKMMNGWLLFSSMRLSACMAASYKGIQAVTYTPQFQPEFMNRTEMINTVDQKLHILVEANNNLLMGTDKISAAYGYDSTFDALNVKDKCVISENETNTIHSAYRCSSTNYQIAVFKDILTEMVSEPDKFNGGLFDDLTLTAFHISSAHIWGSLKTVIDRLVDMCEIRYTKMISNMAIYMSFEIILLLIGFAFVNLMVMTMKSSFNTVLILLQRIPPHEIASNKQILKFLLKRSHSKDTSQMSSAQSVVYNSINGILCTNINGIVEITNPAASSILGFNPEQMLGQPVHTFFNEKSSNQLSQKMLEMQNGECALTYESHMQIRDTSEQEIAVSLVLLGMKNDKEDEKISSFVILFQDETKSIEQQKEAEQAKARSENLLYQILPRDIVMRLNQGEKDISFTVPSASVIFIDIVKFSDYAAHLSPQDIMGCLSEVFAAFDAIAAKYPLITKIKLIGDVYMAAAGLFAKEEEPEANHAIQTVQFGLDCLSALEEINSKLSANLCVRIGVNSGGPVLAGVLGTDKPVFDIIGDPINIAARLQSTDIPGMVQISEATKQLLEGSQFSITERGEVYLKGKGNQMTYFVHPTVDFIGSAQVQH